MTSDAHRILMVDTSGDVGTVALASGTEILAVRHMERARDYAAVLNDTVALVLTDQAVSINSLTAVCVLAGPGSYTGLRIAMAAAKGWCYALDIPLFLQNGLHVLAEESRAARPGFRAYVAVLPARQGEYFFTACDAVGGTLIPPRHLKLSEAEDVLHILPTQCIAIGSVIATAELFSSKDLAGKVVETLDQPIPSVEAWFRIATTQIATGEAADLAYAEPYYLKAAHTTTPKASR